jgi:hypothetical protein
MQVDAWLISIQYLEKGADPFYRANNALASALSHVICNFVANKSFSNKQNPFYNCSSHTLQTSSKSMLLLFIHFRGGRVPIVPMVGGTYPMYNEDVSKVYF